MKVLLCGEISKDNNDGFTLNALKQLNVETEAIDTRGYFKLSLLNRIFNKFRKTPHYFGTRRVNEALLKKAREFKPDFILAPKPILIWPETIKELTKFTKVFSWYPDYVLFPKTCSTYFYKTIPLLDCHFSFNYENSKELMKLGAKKSFFLPCAADLSCHYPVKVSPEEAKKIGADIIFVGTYADEERTWFVEKLCQDGYDVKVYGNSWEKCPKNYCLVKRGRVQFRGVNCCGEMSKVFNASKIVLSFVREHNKELLACRTYEIPACGAFMLHKRTSKTGDVFEEGKEAEFFGSYEEMKEKIDFYLKNDELRKKIAEAGYKKVTGGGNLFVDRVQFIIDIFNSLK